jgi:hypothetical protein
MMVQGTYGEDCERLEESLKPEWSDGTNRAKPNGDGWDGRAVGLFLPFAMSRI